MNEESSPGSTSRVVELLEELVRWTRLQGIQHARAILGEVLKKDAEKLAYQHSDGRGSAEVGKVAGVSDFAVRSYWKRWASIGIVVPSKKFKGRYERIFSLEDLGFEVPSPRGPPTKMDAPTAGAEEEVKLDGSG